MANDLPGLADAIEVAATTRPDYDMAIAREVAEIFVHMLGDGRSVIDPTAVIWTAEVAEELRRRIEDNPILGTDAGQWDKLEHQLAGASREVVLLAAELVFLREQPVFNAAPATRREHLTRVLKMSEPVASVPEWMSACLDRPTEQAGFKGGQDTTVVCGCISSGRPRSSGNGGGGPKRNGRPPGLIRGVCSRSCSMPETAPLTSETLCSS